MITSLSLANSLVQYGVSGLQQGYFDAAIKSFSHALQHDPSSVCAVANRAVAYAHQGNEGTALNDLSRALEFAPQHFTLHFNRAIVQTKLGNVNAAIANFQQAFQVAPHEFAHCLDRSMILLLPDVPSDTTELIPPVSSSSPAAVCSGDFSRGCLSRCGTHPSCLFIFSCRRL